jgi:Uma2 family endonuclease
MMTDLLTRNAWVTRRPLTVQEYHRMGEVGILSEDDRVELIEGQLIAMTPIGSDHHGTVIALTRLLVDAIGDRGMVSVQGPIRLDEVSEPEPDFAVLIPRNDSYRERTARPEEVLLIVEIAHSSLRYDRNIKIPLYARHNIPEVWIVDLVGNCVEVYREPEGDTYTQVMRIGPDGVLQPLMLPGVEISTKAVLG